MTVSNVVHMLIVMGGLATWVTLFTVAVLLGARANDRRK